MITETLSPLVLILLLAAGGGAAHDKRPDTPSASDAPVDQSSIRLTARTPKRRSAHRQLELESDASIAMSTERDLGGLEQAR